MKSTFEFKIFKKERIYDEMPQKSIVAFRLSALDTSLHHFFSSSSFSSRTRTNNLLNFFREFCSRKFIEIISKIILLFLDTNLHN